MRELMLLFCLLGLVLTATIILVTAPGAVTGRWPSSNELRRAAEDRLSISSTNR
jgi:hypothetical protein